MEKNELFEQINKSLDTIKTDAKKASDDLAIEVKKINDAGIESGKVLAEIKEDVDKLKAKKGHSANGEKIEQSAKSILADAFAEHQKAISGVAKGRGFDFQTKTVGTMINSANYTGDLPYGVGAVAARPRRKLHFRELVSVIPSATGSWRFPRPTSGFGEGSFDWQLTHGAAKSQLDYDIEEITVNAEYLAGYVRIAKQMLQDLPYMQSYVSSELIENYMRAESQAFFNTLNGAATGATTTSGSNTVEKILSYVANLMQADFDTTAIVTTAAVWAGILGTKPADYSIPGGVTISPNGEINILGTPLKVSNYLPASKVLLGDFSKVAILQTEGLNTQVYEQDQDNVIKNLITIKTEARVGLAVLRPDAFVYAAS